MGRKKTPQPTRQQLPSEGEPTEADRAYARAVEVCNRILGELDDWLAGETHHKEEARSCRKRQ